MFWVLGRCLNLGSVVGAGVAVGYVDLGSCFPQQILAFRDLWAPAAAWVQAGYMNTKDPRSPSAFHLPLHPPQLKRMFEDLRPAFPQLLRSRRRYGVVLQCCGTSILCVLPTGGISVRSFDTCMVDQSCHCCALMS